VWSWERIWSIWLCLELNARALVSSWKVENLDDLNVGVVGVFIAPTTKLDRWWRLLSTGAPDSPVRQPHHQVVEFRPLELLLVGPPDCPVVHRTGPVGCPVCHPRVLCSSARAGAHLMRCSRPLREVVVAPLSHRTVRCAPDTVRWIIAEWIPEAGKFKVALPWGTEHCPVVHRTVRWIIAEPSENSRRWRVGRRVPWCTGQSGAPDQGTLRYTWLLWFEPFSWSFYWLIVNLWHL
jgi:hypothetical protein